MKVIAKFKGLVAQKRARDGPRGRDVLRGLTGEKSLSDAAAELGAEVHDIVDYATQVLKERARFLREGGAGGAGHAAAAAQEFGVGSEPLFLGVGLGGQDGFAPDAPPPDAVVSDSPTAVDFNVYDRAYEAEVEKIKRSTSRRGSSSNRRHRRPGTANVYPTKHLGEGARYRDVGGSGEALVLGRASSSDVSAVSPFSEKPSVTFADVVTRTMLGGRKAQGTPGRGHEDEDDEDDGEA